MYSMLATLLNTGNTLKVDIRCFNHTEKNSNHGSSVCICINIYVYIYIYTHIYMHIYVFKYLIIYMYIKLSCFTSYIYTIFILNKIFGHFVSSDFHVRVEVA